MAFAATMNWNLRTGGSDSNGGGFDGTSGTPGTDYSLQDAAQIAYTDLVIDGTTNTKCTSAGNPFTSAHVGNVINITSGTGFTVQRVQIMSVSASTATVDKSLGTLSSTGGHGNLGGALLTTAKAAGLVVAGNNVYVKNGTYSQSSSLTLTISGTATLPISWIGYNATPNDGGTPPVITSATNSIILFSLGGVSSNIWNNIKFTHTAATRGYGIASRTVGRPDNIGVYNCIFDGCLSGVDGENAAGNPISNLIVANCEVKNCTNAGLTISDQTLVTGCTIHTNTSEGIRIGNPNAGPNSTLQVVDSLIYANSKGINMNVNQKLNLTLHNVTIAGNTSDGIASSTTSANLQMIAMENVIFDSNGGWGINLTSIPTALFSRNNFYRSNTSGARNNCAAGTGDVTLTADPFTNSAGGDYSLNNTAGGGAAVRAAGAPGAFPNGTTTSHPDGGAVQHQDSGGGGGATFTGFLAT